ncbi:MAG: T9SS type A sorting domain-containing protein [Bacteroidales bacterium]
MKKLFLLSLVLSFFFSAVYAQNGKSDFRIRSAKAVNPATIAEPVQTSDVFHTGTVAVPATKAPDDVNIVTVVPIGTSANAFGFFVDGRTASVWVDNRLNSIAFTHRLQTPSSSHVGYDFSKDGGTTWQVNQLNYDPTASGYSPARYPQGGIINMNENTNPDNAFHTYVAPLLDGSQGTAGSWGGIAYGAKAFASGATSWQGKETTTADRRWFLPDAFTVTQQGVVYFVDQENSWDGAASTYLGNLTIGRGECNAETGEITYEYQSYPLEINSADGINDIEIAFAPDGQTGFISILSNLPTTLPFTSYHPILLKTTDGGLTWSDPIEVQLGGDGGLTAIQEFITDEALIAYFDPEPVPARNEIAYYIGYNQDLSVDAWGNPHIAGDVMLANLEDGTIATGAGFLAMFHIWSPDGGLTWDSFKLGDLLQFSAEWTGGGSTVSQYNRPQISTTQDGTLVFFSWIDSNIEEATDNSQPDIYFRDFIPYSGVNGTHGEEIISVTQFSAAMWKSNWATMPYYVFSHSIDATSIECTIPFVYQTMTDGDPSLPTQFNYIPDFKRTYTITSAEEMKHKIASVSQNFPNPFNGETNITVTLAKSSNVAIDVYNLTGQKVYTHNYGQQQTGTFNIALKSESLTEGVYFYTIDAGGTKVTRKMIVK